MFKIGQRVWSFVHKKIMWVSEIRSTGCFLADNEKLLINYYHSNDEFHQTADDMFEVLGFSKRELKDSVVFTFKKYSKLRIYVSKEYQSFTVSLADTSISIDVLEAVKQKIIELGNGAIGGGKVE